MKFTLSRLKAHLDTTAEVTEIAEALTDLGLEVESIENPADRLKHFTLAKVKEAKQHPDADRLRVCTVETNEGDVQIVCGAPNARAGITVVLAKPGDYVPGIDVTLSVGTIRGVESCGMMCSERELELSDEHNGIIELPSGEVGQPFVDYLVAHDPAKIDPVIDIAITPNRGDALGVRGIARDLAARGLGVLKPCSVDPVPATFQSHINVTIDADTLHDAPVFYGRLIKGVKNGPSPQWLQDQLKAIGLRPISFLVDVTNFFTFELNRPLHVFDADKITGNLRVHRASGGETLTALDDKSYEMPAGAVVISDDTGVQSIAGIMGGNPTGCSDETTDVFVESAYWTPVQIAETGRALKINSDARYRFERGIDPTFTAIGLEHAVRMIVDHAGGQASEVVVAGQIPDVSRSYDFDPGDLKRLVGMDLPQDAQIKILSDLGFEVSGNTAGVPGWRSDVQGSADLIEEIARVASLSKLEGSPLPRLTAGVAASVLTPLQTRSRIARRAAAAAGYNECVTYSFIDARSAALFNGPTDALELSNPISSDMSHMRPALIPGLLQAAARNQARGFDDLALFEIGEVFHSSTAGNESRILSAVLIGRTGPKDVHSTSRPVDVFDVKTDIEDILAALNAPARVQIKRDGDNIWHPGRHGVICLGPQKLGIFGEIHPKILRAYDIKGSAMALTVFLENIPQPKKQSATRPALNVSEYQAVARDFAFVVDQNIEALTLVNAAQGTDKALIQEVRVFDEFTNGNLPEGKKSLAITVRLQPRSATLTEKDIEAVSAKVIDKVVKATGAVLRA